MNLQACTTKATLQLVKMHTNSVTLCLCESLKYLNQFQCISHNIFTTYNSFYVVWKNTSLFHRNPWQCDFPHKVKKEKAWEPKGQLIRVSDVIFQDLPMARLILSSSTKNRFCRLTPTKISKSINISFSEKPTFC